MNTIKKHYSIDLEKAVLASLLSIENSFEIVSEIIGVNDFYAARHQLIYSTVSQLHEMNEPYDLVMVTDRLVLTGDMKAAGGNSYIAEMLSTSPATLFNLETYSKKIKDYARTRATISALTEARARIDHRVSDNDLESEINDIVSGLTGITENTDKQAGPESASDLLGAFFERIGNAAKTGVTPFLPTGFFDLDIKSPLEKGDLVIVGARPSMGKTTFAMNILDNMINSTGKAGVFFSLEMGKEIVISRYMAARAGVSLKKVRSGQGLDEDEWAAMMKAATDIKNGLPFIVDDRSSLTVTQMRTELNRLRQAGHDIGVVVIDYLQIMGGIDGDNRATGLGEVTRQLKGLAKEFGMPIFLLSQLNRSLENRPNKRPINSDLRESGAIEQDADVIMFLYRDEVYNEASDNKGVAEVIIGKNRNGEIGTVRLGFEGQYSRFSNFMPMYDENA